MSAGQHKATVVLDGKSDGLNKAARESSNRVGVLETQVDKLREELARATQRLDEQTTALERHRQQVRADAEATRQARAEQKEWSAAIRRAKAEIATAEKAQADATRKAKAEIAAAEKAQADTTASAARRMQEAGGRTSTGIEQQASAWSRARGALADYTLIAGGAFSAMERGAQIVSELADRSTRVNNVMGNLPFSIDKARAATGGMVKDMELASAASTLMSTGVIDNAKDFAELAHAAQALGGRVGIDTPRAMESLTAALSRGSTEMLDNLGVVLKKDQALQAYAATLGKTVDALTDAEEAEAFQKVAMQRIIEAARGVKVDTDSAGAAVQRFEADLDRLQNKALGGAESNITLRKGLQQLALTYKDTRAEVAQYRSSADPLREQLRDLNVSTVELMTDNRSLADALTQVRKEELSRIENLIFTGQATEENVQQLEFLRSALSGVALAGHDAVDAAIERQEEEALATRKARKALDDELAGLELSIAFLEGKGDEERLLNAALVQEMELRAQILDMEGKSVEAAKLRRDIEVRGQRAAGQALRKGRSGGGKAKAAEWSLDAVFGDTEKILARLERQEQRAQASLDRTGAGAAKRFAMLHEQLERSRAAAEGLQEVFDKIDAQARGEDTPFSLEAFAAVKAREAELRAANDELGYNRRAREAGSLEDPIARMEAETGARLDLLEARRQATFDSLELARIEDEREAALHALKMARLEEEKSRREASLEKYRAIAEESADIMLGLGEAALRAALLEGGGVKAKVAGLAKSLAFEHGMLALSEGIKAVIAAASFNPVGAALHASAAAKSAAFGLSMAAIAGAAGGFTSKVKVGGDPIGAGAFGAGGAANGTGGYGGAGGGGGSGGPSSPIPESPEPGVPRSAQLPPGAVGGAGVVNNFNGPIYGTLPKAFVQQTDRQMRDLGYSQRRVGNG